MPEALTLTFSDELGGQLKVIGISMGLALFTWSVRMLPKLADIVLLLVRVQGARVRVPLTFIVTTSFAKVDVQAMPVRDGLK